MFQNRMDNRFIIVSLLNANRFILKGDVFVFQCLEGSEEVFPRLGNGMNYERG